MKVHLIIPIALFALFSCNQNTASTDEISEDKNSIGGYKDEHGCYTSAGYRWSELKNDCVQIFNVGQRLNPIDQKEDEAVISSFIIMSSDHNQAELHIGEQQLILNKTSQYVYEKDAYKYDYKKCLLYIDDQVAYELEESK